MDIQLEKKKGLQKKHIPYVAGGVLFVILLGWIIFGDHASTLKVDARGISIGNVTREQFNDFFRMDGQVQPITVVQLSPEEGGIVQEKVVEEGAQVKKGDIIVRLSNSNLDLQILNAEAELAEKQNFLRNTQVTMEQDKLTNQMEKLQYDMDMNRIESMTILKDAAATAMYGSRAANGVVVVTTVPPVPGELRVSYNFTGPAARSTNKSSCIKRT